MYGNVDKSGHPDLSAMDDPQWMTMDGQNRWHVQN